MKRMIMMLIAALFLMGSVQAVSDNSNARSEGILTVFDGYVYIDGMPADDYKVFIYCEHYYENPGEFMTKLVENTRTDETGYYRASHLNWPLGVQCLPGDTAYIEVKDGDNNVVSEDETVVEEDFGTSEGGYANIGINSVGVPEFSVATMAAAIVGVTLGIVALRRKE